jgi:nucleotide-binding universal stress UspA family protein
MSSHNAPLGILVGIDDSPTANLAVQWAARDAELRNIPLTLVHAISPEVTWSNQLSPGLKRWQQDHGHRLVGEALKIVAEASQLGGPAGIHSRILPSAAVPALVDLSKDAEMVVTGCRGSGRWPGRPLGSVSSGLLRYAHCPVAIIHDDDPSLSPRSQAPVLVGIDGSSASESATAMAFDEASRRHVELVALHAWSDADQSGSPEIAMPETESMAEVVLAERLAGWREQYPDVPVNPTVVRDNPARQLVLQSEAAQLVVVGSRGRGGLAGMLLGSVGETVAQMARVPVIVARVSAAQIP